MIEKRIERYSKMEKLLTCYLCRLSFGRSKDYIDHLNNNHSRYDKYFCDRCNKKYRAQKTMRQHIEKFHRLEGRPTHCCLYCPYETNDKSNFGHHLERYHQITNMIEVNTEAAPIEETITLIEEGSILPEKTPIEVQLPRPFRCIFCTKNFKQTGELATHIHQNHIKNQQCEICLLQFSNRQELSLHQTLLHPKKIY